MKFEKNPLRIVACIVFKTLRNLKHKFSAHKSADYGSISLKVKLVPDIVPTNVSIKFEKNPYVIVACIAFTTLRDPKTQVFGP